MPDRFASLKFPLGGLVKRVAVQYQSPFTTPSSLNVRPDDPIAGRERGGSRPPVVKAFAAQLGSGNPVRLATELTWITGGAPTTIAMYSSNKKLYRESAGNLTEIATYSGAIALRNDRLLSAASLNQLLYIAGRDNTPSDLCVYTPGTDTLATLTSTGGISGTVPTGNTIVVEWRGRLLLCGDGTSNWYMSRQFNAKDWNYAATDPQAAIAGDLSIAGQPAETGPTLAAIPHNDECCLLGTATGMWVFRGDPGTGGGRLVPLSRKIGIFGHGAWCYDNEGWLYWLSHDGIYMMPPGCGDMPRSASRERLPEELLNLDRTLYEVAMCYSARSRGVELYVTSLVAGTSKHYFLDTKTTAGNDQSGPAVVAFFPQGYQTDHDAYSIHSRRDHVPSASTRSSVFVGCRDGYVRVHDTAETQDDGGNAVDWHVDFGPFPLAPPGMEGRLDELQFTGAESSGNVTVAVRTGLTAEQANNAAALETYTMAAGLNGSVHPRVRGNQAVVRVSGTTKAAFEELLVRRTPAGRRLPV